MSMYNWNGVEFSNSENRFTAYLSNIFGVVVSYDACEMKAFNSTVDYHHTSWAQNFQNLGTYSAQK